MRNARAGRSTGAAARAAPAATAAAAWDRRAPAAVGLLFPDSLNLLRSLRQTQRCLLHSAETPRVRTSQDKSCRCCRTVCMARVVRTTADEPTKLWALLQLASCTS